MKKSIQKNSLAFVFWGLIMMLVIVFSSCTSKNSNYIGKVQTYWVNEYNITDYSKDIKCCVYRNSESHWYEIEYEGARYELVRQFPLDVNEDGSLIFKFRFKDYNHYIEDIP